MAMVYVYVTDTMADWELAHVMAELHSKRFFKKDAKTVEVKTVSVSETPVHTMGGLTIVPDLTLSEMEIEAGNVLLLPGADTWNAPGHEKILDIAEAFLEKGALVAAICGATTALAERGLLDDRKHTSNGAGFLDMFCQNYHGAEKYVDQPAVRDGNLITAAGTGGLSLAKLVLEYLEVLKEDTLSFWYSYFSKGDAMAFFAMMSSLQN